MSWFGVATATILTALVGLLALARRRYLVVTVRGASMTPAYQDGERLLARRLRPRETPERDTVVVVDLPPVEVDVARLGGPDSWVEPATTTTTSGRMIKRVAAVPEDPVPPEIHSEHAYVPTGMVALRGDNTAGSIDSRHYGLVAVERCGGTVLRRMGG